MPTQFGVILTLVLALVGPLQQAIADGKITAQEVVDIIQKITPALMQAFPNDAKYINLIQQIAMALGQFLQAP